MQFIGSKGIKIRIQNKEEATRAIKTIKKGDRNKIRNRDLKQKLYNYKISINLKKTEKTKQAHDQCQKN